MGSHIISKYSSNKHAYFYTLNYNITQLKKHKRET